MDYDFSKLCADQLDKLEKRLVSLKKSFVKDYMVALQVINNHEANKCMGEIKQKIEDLINDEIKKSTIFWTECMNKTQRELGAHL